MPQRGQHAGAEFRQRGAQQRAKVDAAVGAGQERREPGRRGGARREDGIRACGPCRRRWGDLLGQYAVERGVVPHTIAMEIAKAKEGEVQQALAKAYEEKAIPGNQVLAIRQIIEQRNASGKGLHQRSSPHRGGKHVTSEALIRAYQRETERQRQLVKRASLTQGRLMFVTNALKRLLADDHFVALMRAEGVGSVPAALAERIGYDRG